MVFHCFEGLRCAKSGWLYLICVAPLLFVPGAPLVVRGKTTLYAEKDSAEVEKLKARLKPRISDDFLLFSSRFAWNLSESLRFSGPNVLGFSGTRLSWSSLKLERLQRKPRQPWRPRKRPNQARLKVESSKSP